MKHYRSVLIIGIIEILIGAVTLISNFISLALHTNEKSFSVLVFVQVAGTISTLLGIGILFLRKIAYQLLLYFSSFVLLSKILILMGVFHLNGALETAIPSFLKSSISIIYHGFVIYYLLTPGIKKIFHN